MSKLEKQIQTILFTNDSFCHGNHALELIAEKIKLEFEMEEDADTLIGNTPRTHLYRVWHATRAFDSGLRLFLEKFGRVPALPNQHSLGGYLNALQTGVTAATPHRQLDGNTATNIQREVVDIRNVYAHVAGKIPTKPQANFVIGKILQYYIQIYSLEK